MNEDHTLEKLKIHERLASVETKLDSLDSDIKVIYKNVVGTENSVGLRTEVHVLKESEKSRQVAIGRIWTAIMAVGSTIVGKIFLDWFKRG